LAQVLHQQSQVSLAELLQIHPLQHGLAELVIWLQMASEQPRCMIDEEKTDVVHWRTNQGLVKQVTLPHVLFVR